MSRSLFVVVLASFTTITTACADAPSETGRESSALAAPRPLAADEVFSCTDRDHPTRRAVIRVDADYNLSITVGAAIDSGTLISLAPFGAAMRFDAPRTWVQVHDIGGLRIVDYWQDVVNEVVECGPDSAWNEPLKRRLEIATAESKERATTFLHDCRAASEHSFPVFEHETGWTVRPGLDGRSAIVEGGGPSSQILSFVAKSKTSDTTFQGEGESYQLRGGEFSELSVVDTGGRKQMKLGGIDFAADTCGKMDTRRIAQLVR